MSHAITVRDVLIVIAVIAASPLAYFLFIYIAASFKKKRRH